MSLNLCHLVHKICENQKAWVFFEFQGLRNLEPTLIILMFFPNAKTQFHSNKKI